MTSSLNFPGQLAAGTSTMSIASLFNAWTAGQLDLRPPFQRNLVWNQDQQSLLVDSVLRGLPVPEVYVQTSIDDDGKETTIVVDGQQRISALLAFLNGEYPLTSNEAELDPLWSAKSFSDLDTDLKRRFREFEMVVRKLPTMNDSSLRQIFSRLNKTVEALEPQELRHAAYTSPFIRMVEAIGGRSEFTQIGVFSPLDYRRRRNDEFMAEVAFAVGAKAFPNKKEDLDRLFRTFDQQGVPEEYLQDLEQRFGRLLALLDKVGPLIRKTRFRNKSDFYSLCVRLSLNAELLVNVDIKALMTKLTAFSDCIAEIRRAENAGESIDAIARTTLGKVAVPYLRSVERAASDRLSRVRRDEALSRLLKGLFDRVSPVPLSEEDRSWREITVDQEEEQDEPDTSDLELAQAILNENPQ